jgi:hypothetical protein
MLGHETLSLGYGELPEMKNARGQYRIRTAFLHTRY